MNESGDHPSGEMSLAGSRPLNFFQRLIGIFASPQKTLEDIAARPNWPLPLALIVLVTFLLTQMAVPAILADAGKAMEKVMEKQQLTPEQMERAREMGLTYTKNFSGVTAGVYSVVMSVVAAAALLFVGNIVLNGKANFRQVFSIYVWTGMVGLLGYLIRAPIALQRKTMMVFFGPAIFFPAGSEESALFKIAASLDVFSIWRLALVTIGFAAVYRIGLNKSMTTLGTLYVLLIAVSVVFSGFFGR